MEGFLSEEKRKLDQYHLVHRPTIGRMYEGLTSEVLNRAIPEALGLQVVSGFVFDDSGQMSGHIDCMLVKGLGDNIPYTADYKWHIEDVIAVLEVKKNLHSRDLSDAYTHLRCVHEIYARQILSGLAEGSVDISTACKAFAQVTRKVAPAYSELHVLPMAEEMIFHILVMEHLSPTRIILGHHGFRSEYSFREAMLGFLEQNINRKGFGPGSFPQLIISDSYSLVKANGQPYSAAMRNDHWPFYSSSSANPLIFVLELIWTRLQREYELGDLWGEDLQQERMHELLAARATEIDGKVGWAYRCTVIAKAEIEQDGVSTEWSPVFLDVPRFVILQRLCAGHVIDVEDPEFVHYVKSGTADVDDFVDSLLDTGLVALDGSTLELITESCQCAILPTGQCVAAENNTGRLSRWMERKFGGRTDS